MFIILNSATIVSFVGQEWEYFSSLNDPENQGRSPIKPPGHCVKKAYHFDISIYHIVVENIVSLDLACLPFLLIINVLPLVSQTWHVV